jgi:IS4 transposase
MKERVDVREWIEFQWDYLVTFLGGRARISELAYATGAFSRSRKIADPEVLLQLLLMWTVGEQSLKDTAALAAEKGLVDVSDVALIKRFHKCGDWLGALLGQVLIDRQAELAGGLRIRVIDATAITRAGSKGTDHRVHLGIDLKSNRIDSAELTTVKGGESFDRFSIQAGEILVADAAYAQRTALARVDRAGGYFVVRFPWSNVPLETMDGEPFDLFGFLRTLPEAAPGAAHVQFRAANQGPIRCRVVAIRKSEPAAQEARQKALRQRKKNGEVIDPRTIEATSYIFLLTNLPEEISPESVLGMYRLRWQIEMKFKTLKSVIHLERVPVRTDQALHVHVLTKLLIALLIESLVFQGESFSPGGYPLTGSQRMAADAVPS